MMRIILAITAKLNQRNIKTAMVQWISQPYFEVITEKRYGKNNNNKQAQ